MTMEKYGVDGSDPVEEEAIEMVKEGSEKSIGDARKKVVSKRDEQSKESE